MNIINVKRVVKNYREGQRVLRILSDVSLTIGRGEFCALTGPSGSGKTTLMNMIGLLDRPSDGKILINGTDTTVLNADAASKLRSRVIGFVFQSFHLLAHYTALDNVALPLVYAGVGKKERRERAESLLFDVGLADRMYHRPGELSGGQRQRIAIARALVGTPSLLLADEPTGNLDSRAANDIMSMLLHLNETLGLSVIIVTHDPLIAGQCSRKITMRDGRILDDEASERFGMKN
ncbi:ABC transporter ATP-binding protein [Thalassospira lucentensis]|uniref:ABC transporter ATP-binding protein n=1 Tax=Thalassospira lucentensis TaxID=168935 RepID=UPI002943DB7A|nr:ABC transporter ATP-binding protein [Thalassospira lucentensis]WOI10015.1 ABC transporter ATP-binding protein [Thalassospira lucentensis]